MALNKPTLDILLPGLDMVNIEALDIDIDVSPALSQYSDSSEYTNFSGQFSSSEESDAIDQQVSDPHAESNPAEGSELQEIDRTQQSEEQHDSHTAYNPWEDPITYHNESRPHFLPWCMYNEEPVKAQDTDISARTFHHVSYFGQPVFERSSTSPATSLAIIKALAGKLPQFKNEPKSLYKSVLFARSSQYIDPIIYDGPRQILNELWGSRLQEAVTGYCAKFYRPVGSWWDDNYVPGDDIPTVDFWNGLQDSSTQVVLNGSLPCEFLANAAHEWQFIEDEAAALRPKPLSPYTKGQRKEPTPKSRLDRCWTGTDEEDIESPATQQDGAPVDQEKEVAAREVEHCAQQSSDSWKERLDKILPPLEDWSDDVDDELNEAMAKEGDKEYSAQPEEVDWKARLVVVDERTQPLWCWADTVDDIDDVVYDEVMIEGPPPEQNSDWKLRWAALDPRNEPLVDWADEVETEVNHHLQQGDQETLAKGDPQDLAVVTRAFENGSQLKNKHESATPAWRATRYSRGGKKDWLTRNWRRL